MGGGISKLFSLFDISALTVGAKVRYPHLSRRIPDPFISLCLMKSLNITLLVFDCGKSNLIPSLIERKSGRALMAQPNVEPSPPLH
jgi:hypothetical protein